MRESAAAPERPGQETVAPEAVPVLAMSRQELEWFALSPAASRWIAQVDGVAPLDAVCSQAA
jgi:hypothetical protein